MHRAFVPTAAAPVLNSDSELASINERLSLALQGSNQIAFDWRISDDTLFFSGSLDAKLKGLLLDTSNTWHSSSLPSIIHEDDLDNFRQRLHEALKGHAETPDSHYQAEVRLKDAALAWRWVSIRGKIIERAPDGRAVRMAGTFLDINERKHAEKQAEHLRRMYAMLSQVSQAIIRIHDRDLLFREVCRIAVEHGHFSAAWISMISSDGKKELTLASYGRPSECRQRQLDELAASTMTPERDQASDLFPADTARHSTGRLTLLLNDVPYGTLNLQAPDPGFFVDQILEVLETVARDISFAINHIEHEAQRKAHEAALMESESIKSAILTLALDCIISIDRNGHILSFNKSAETAFGIQSGDTIGKELADIIIPPEWREQHRAEIARFLTADESSVIHRRIELNAMRSDGSTFPIELAVVPIRSGDQSFFTAFIRDISELKRSEAKLKERAKNYRQLVELAPQATLVCQDNKIVLINQAACRLLHAKHPGELLGLDILEFVHPDDHALIAAQTLPTSHYCKPADFVEQTWRSIGGNWFNAEVGASSMLHNDMPSVQFVVRDITVRKHSEALQLGQNRILNMVATGESLPGILAEIARFAEARTDHVFCAIHRHQPDDTSGFECIAPSLNADHIAHLHYQSTNSNGHVVDASHLRSVPSLRMTNARRPEEGPKKQLAVVHKLEACASWPIVGKSRRVLGRIAFYCRDRRSPTDLELELLRVCAELAGTAIESRASEERIRYLAHYDGLTSLPNRFLFKEYLDVALRNAQRHMKKFAVLFLDLDKFKEINDTLGHDAGDLVLREMAKRMRGCLRHNDKIARMGGDEFYVLIEDLTDGFDAAEVAQKLLEEVSRPVRIGEHECSLSVSIGISIYPEDGIDGQTLLGNADKAMYCAKEQGKNGFQFFSSREMPDKPALTLLRPNRLVAKARMRLV